MEALQKYAETYLEKEIEIVKSSSRNGELTSLTVFEKALVYKYSDDGYLYLNEDLRKSKGAELSEFGIFLSEAISKLPDFTGLTYRKVYLTSKELSFYKTGFDNGQAVTENAFVSATKSRMVAMQYKGLSKHAPNCLFRIYSKTGKEIEKVAKFGEKEVLTAPGKSFIVLGIEKELDCLLITLEEV